jgi:Ran-binding protein 9/10
LNRFPGWEQGSWAYHGDDGKSYHDQACGDQYGPTFTTDDVVGCCVNFEQRIAFYTKNGELLDAPFTDLTFNISDKPRKGDIYPTIGLHSSGEHVEVNFGKKPFVFNIMEYV